MTIAEFYNQDQSVIEKIVAEKMVEAKRNEGRGVTVFDDNEGTEYEVTFDDGELSGEEPTFTLRQTGDNWSGDTYDGNTTTSVTEGLLSLMAAEIDHQAGK